MLQVMNVTLKSKKLPFSSKIFWELISGQCEIIISNFWLIDFYFSCDLWILFWCTMKKRKTILFLCHCDFKSIIEQHFKSWNIPHSVTDIRCVRFIKVEKNLYMSTSWSKMWHKSFFLCGKICIPSPIWHLNEDCNL